jgi:hypothetical protein
MQQHSFFLLSSSFFFFLLLLSSSFFLDVSPEEIMKADQAERQQQYLAAMTPGAIAAAEMELSSVFSGVIGSLLTNMLTQEPELVREHMGLASKK